MGEEQMIDYFTVDEVAELFRVSSRTVRNWIAEEKLEAILVGGRRIRIPARSLDTIAVPYHRHQRM
jgi:excisionase family DNA binding protein